MTEDLLPWLRAQIAETRREAGDWPDNLDERWYNVPSISVRSVLAQCEAHTALIDYALEADDKGDRDERLIRIVALVYQHNPGYQEAWRPDGTG